MAGFPGRKGFLPMQTLQALIEIPFDLLYLISVVTFGLWMILHSGDSRQHRLFGIMAVVLGCGDAFHLVPRVIALATTGMQDYTVPLGLGKLVTSITMTIFYVILYQVWRLRYHVTGRRGLTAAVVLLAAVRILLCLMPQNQWTSAVQPLSWGILRNLPFAVLGGLLIVLFYQEIRRTGDQSWKLMPQMIAVSFACYIPVVLWAEIVPAVGMLMLPKTCAYLAIVVMGLQDLRRSLVK